MPTVGDRWEAPEGLRRMVFHRVIVGVATVNGEERFAVRTGDSPFSGLYNLEDLLFEQRRDAANVANLARVRAVQVRAAQEHAELDGFMDDAPKVQLYRARANLAKNIQLGGKIISIRDAMRKLAAEGATVSEHPKDGLRVLLPSGFFYTERDLTRTGVQYLQHILALPRRVFVVPLTSVKCTAASSQKGTP